MNEVKEIEEISWKRIIIYFLIVISGFLLIIIYLFELFANDMIGKLTRSLSGLVEEFILFIEVNIILFIALVWIIFSLTIFYQDKNKV